MSQEEALRIANELYEAYNTRDFERIKRYISEKTEWTNVSTGQTFRGWEGYLEFVRGWTDAFPDSKIEITNQVSSGDCVVSEFRGRGLHQGPLKSPAGDIPPTGRRVDIPFCDVTEIENGKVKRDRLYFDSATLLRQIGVLPEATPAQAGMH